MAICFEGIWKEMLKALSDAPDDEKRLYLLRDGPYAYVHHPTQVLALFSRPSQLQAAKTILYIEAARLGLTDVPPYDAWETQVLVTVSSASSSAFSPACPFPIPFNMPEESLLQYPPYTSVGEWKVVASGAYDPYHGDSVHDSCPLCGCGPDPSDMEQSMAGPRLRVYGWEVVGCEDVEWVCRACLAVITSRTCGQCHETFASRNKLFVHLSEHPQHAIGKPK